MSLKKVISIIVLEEFVVVIFGFFNNLKKKAYIRKEKESYRLYIKNLLDASNHTYSDVN